MSELKIQGFSNTQKTSAPINEAEKDLKLLAKKEVSKNVTTKVVLSGLALTGAIGLAIMAIKSGKISTVTVDSFKEQGNKFIKGKAFKPNGKPFTGIIEQMHKDGKKYSMQYVDGVLQKVDKSKKC